MNPLKKTPAGLANRLILPLAVQMVLAACRMADKPLSLNGIPAVKPGVLAVADSAARGIASKGPVAWLNYFENSPDFFMANQGAVKFHSYKEAETFIRDTLVYQIKTIKLKWFGMRVDSLSPGMATLSAGFHEDMTAANEKIIPVEGYFTSTVHLTPAGWKFRNIHWSAK